MNKGTNENRKDQNRNWRKISTAKTGPTNKTTAIHGDIQI